MADPSAVVNSAVINPRPRLLPTSRSALTILRRVSGRLLYLALVFLIVTFLVSIVLRLIPGDPAITILGENATPDQIAAVRADLGLDLPVLEQYWNWLMGFFQGDLGVSFRTGVPVTDSIIQRLPVSVQLMVLAQIIAIGVAMPLALYSAYRPNGFVDRLATGAAFTVISVPAFVFGLVLIFIFSVQLKWLPAVGFNPLSDGLLLNLSTVLLPAIAMAAEPSGVYLRLLRGDLLVTLREDYILGAQAKGMTASNLMIRQALRPSSISFVTLAGLNTARMIGGMVVVESLFALPGVGRFMIDSIRSNDLVAVQGVVALIAVLYVVINAIVDVAYLIIDPRTRSNG